MPEKRACGNCGCYGGDRPQASIAPGKGEGLCYARLPTRAKPYRGPGYYAVVADFECPVVAASHHCVHDWLPKGGHPDVIPLAATEADIIKEPAPFSEGEEHASPPASTSFMAPVMRVLTGRARDALISAGINTIQELSTFTEEDAASLKGVGPAVIVEFKKYLEVNGLAFMEPGAAEEVPCGG